MKKWLSQLLDACNDQALPVAETDLRRATAGLLLEVVRADFNIDGRELDNIRRLLESRFGLSGQETAQELSLALDASERSTSIHALIQMVNQQANDADKTSLIEDCWAVAYADGQMGGYEEYQIRRIAELLYVPHHAFIRAKLKAQAQLEKS